jgi:hypothetical protein
MSHEGIVTRIHAIEPIKGADFIVRADVADRGTVIASVIVSKETKIGDLGIFFAPDTQLSVEYCEANNLLELKDDAGNKIAGSGYLSPNKRRIVAKKFKGVKSMGLWMPMTSLDWIKDNSKKPSESFKDGDTIGDYMRSDAVLIPIARRYPRAEIHVSTKGKRNRDAYTPVFRVDEFPKHPETVQLVRDIDSIPIGAKIIITEKLHGTSHRQGNVKVTYNLNRFKTFVNKLAALVNRTVFKSEEYAIVHGTRNTVLYPGKTGSFYGNELFRFNAANAKNIDRDIMVYGEIVGYTTTGKAIMSQHSTKDFKELAKRFGPEITYNYGQDPETCTFYVYRISSLNNGIERDFPFDAMCAYANTLGYKCVEVRHVIESYDGNKEALLTTVKKLAEPNGWYNITGDRKHIDEGVVLRIEYMEGEFLQVRHLKYKSAGFYAMEGFLTDEQIIEDETI